MGSNLKLLPESLLRYLGRKEDKPTPLREMSNRGSSSSLAAPLDIYSFLHTPYYCEENVYFLCEKLCKSGMANADGSDLFVVFISNEDKQIPLWHQKASKMDGFVLWDYHVICVQCKGNGNALQEIWDLDSTLPFPCPLRRYVAEAIRPSSHLNSKYSRLFRVVHAPMFLYWFASDRRHMKNPEGGWVSQPPAYEPIVAEDGAVNNLDKYIQMCAGDATENEGDKANQVFCEKIGVVVNETQLLDFFNQID